ncbi:hypothetical protein CCAX7_14440 [Capsulimonas corticalis]|uniref:Uncharacterized protein n=1 Tax=Capsulimonas corticalis TaxID=2219043 RepID=A0A402CZK5_9BACT|nr:sialidase family protein [Capsulimonas corticalis]BDI29393.1 hypothetical protein CCAX7_14440 [Capsulimonas corticalis]
MPTPTIPRVGYTDVATIPLLRIFAQGVGAPPTGFSGVVGWEFNSDSYYSRRNFYKNKLIAGAYQTSAGAFTVDFVAFTGTLNSAGYSETATMRVTTTGVNALHEFYEWGNRNEFSAFGIDVLQNQIDNPSLFTYYFTDTTGVLRWIAWRVFFIVSHDWGIASGYPIPSPLNCVVGREVFLLVTLADWATTAWYNSWIGFRLYDQSISGDEIPNGLASMDVGGFSGNGSYSNDPQFFTIPFRPLRAGSYTVYLCSNGFGALNVAPIAFDVNVAPAPSTSSPPRSGEWHYRINAQIAMPSGGGAPRLYLSIARMYNAVNAGTFVATSSAVRVCASLDFGETFRAGVDIGTEAADGSALGDGRAYHQSVSGNSLGAHTFAVLPSGRLYVNGQSGAPINGMWRAARISDDDGKTWRNATMLNGAQDDRATVLTPAVGATPVWVSRGAYAGSHGAGGRTGGGWMMMGLSDRIDRNCGRSRVSYDGGDTWQVDETMHGVNYRGPAIPLNFQNEPQLPVVSHIRGISTDGGFTSLDDYRKDRKAIGVVFPGNPDDDHRFTRALVTADTDVTYNVGSGSGGFGSYYNNLYISRGADFKTTQTIRLKYSPLGDGTGLLDMQLSASLWTTGFAWGGRIVIVGVDIHQQDLIRVYVSDNGGEWFRETCRSADCGATWKKTTEE